jgi:hypothetical protein
MYYKQKSGKHKPPPTQYSSPMLKQPVYKKVQTNLKKPVSTFNKGNPGNNINHIIKKYNQAPSQKQRVRPNNINHQRNRPNSNVLDSINKNMKRTQGQSNGGLTQSGIPVKRTIVSQTKEKIGGGTSGQFMGKYLKMNTSATGKMIYDKKRNFSPIGNQRQLMTNNQLFQKEEKKVINVTQNNLNQSSPKPIQVQGKRRDSEANDSLGGGSRVNTKTGSVLGFGNNSRIPDNMSVISR